AADMLGAGKPDRIGLDRHRDQRRARPAPAHLAVAGMGLHRGRLRLEGDCPAHASSLHPLSPADRSALLTLTEYPTSLLPIGVPDALFRRNCTGLPGSEML